MDEVTLPSMPDIAIDMEQYGIDSVVLTTSAELEKLIDDLKSLPDSHWAGGQGKQYMLTTLCANLPQQDAFFNQHLAAITSDNQRWKNFCDDCVILAALNVVLHKRPIHLLHPDSFKQLRDRSLKDAAGSVSAIPLIPGIPVVQ
jgi:hypothetical protein